MRRPSRPVLLSLGLVIAAGLVWLLARGSAVAVTSAPAIRGALTVTLAAEGVTRARELYAITAPVAGRLERIVLERGDTVAAGDLVGRILPSPQDPRTVTTLRAEARAARAAREDAVARLAQAEVRARQARQELERRRPLFDEGALSREAMERIETEAELAGRALEAARSTVAAADATLASAEARLLGSAPDEARGPAVEIVAPVSGRVVTLPDRSARVVSAGAPILELADTDALEIVVDVLSQEAVAIEPGQPMHVTEWGGTESFRGQVRSVTRAGYTEISALGVEEQRVDVVVAVPRPPPSLGTGYRVAGEIVVWTSDDVLTVPSSAIFRSMDRDVGNPASGEGWALFVIEDGRARLRKVRIGREGRDRVQIVEGVVEGERVVTFPPAELGDGARVRAGEG